LNPDKLEVYKMGHIAIYLTSMSVGGAQRIALNLCNGLTKKGHTVDLLLQTAEGTLLEELPDTVSIIDLKASRVATSISPLRKYLREKSPDVLYSMMIEVNIAAVVAHYLAGRDTRLVISEHNTPTVSAEGLKDNFTLRLASLMYPRADHIITVSEGVRNDLLNLADVPEEKVTTIYNPIDVERIRKQATEPVDHKWFTDPSIHVIMSAGRHAPQKGFDILLRAFSYLEGSNARLVLLGEGNETESLQTLATQLGIKDQVDFPGFVDNPFKYMASADVFVLSSWYEGFGNVLIEAMATGCPVVSTDCPSGPNEILKDGAYGPLVPVKDATALSHAIEDVLADPIDESVLASRADDFSIDTVVERYEKLLLYTYGL